INASWLNQARFGYVRNRSATQAVTPFSWSDVGVSEGSTSEANALPSLLILGSASIASGFPRTFTQNSFDFGDDVVFTRKAHTVRFGGGATRVQDDIDIPGFGSLVEFLSWPDFLLGLSGAGNGTGTFSNVLASADAFGLFNREYRAWQASAFVQDDWKVSRF